LYGQISPSRIVLLAALLAGFEDPNGGLVSQKLWLQLGLSLT
jgi:hypothetical protein